MPCPKNIISYGILLCSIYKAYLTEARFQIIFTELFKLNHASMNEKIYIVISGNKWEREWERTKVWQKVEKCASFEYTLRCFLKSNFYNHHIVCQNPGSKYWLLTKKGIQFVHFYNDCICIFLCVSLWGRLFNREHNYCNCTIYYIHWLPGYVVCRALIYKRKQESELIYLSIHGFRMSRARCESISTNT